MNSSRKLYRSFLVRCWCETGDPQKWRFLLQEIGVAPESARGFADFERFVTFLRGELLNEASDNPAAHENERGETNENE